MLPLWNELKIFFPLQFIFQNYAPKKLKDEKEVFVLLFFVLIS